MGDKSGSGDGAGCGDERLDALFTALADRHRRRAISYFPVQGDDVASVDDLITFAHDGGSRSDRHRLEVLFHHAALPKLADLGLVEYDPRSGTVRYRGPRVLEQVLDVVEESKPGPC